MTPIPQETRTTSTDAHPATDPHGTQLFDTDRDVGRLLPPQRLHRSRGGIDVAAARLWA